MRQIAYVGEDGQIYVTDLDLGTRTPVSDSGDAGDGGGRDLQALHNWPTWSPDGLRLAFFRFEVAGGEVRRSAVRTVAADGTDPVDLYAGGAGTAPIYMGWAPDGSRLALLVQEDGQLYLRIAKASGDEAPRTVCHAAPLYFTWRPDSRALVAHVGPEERGARASRILWIEIDEERVTEASLLATVERGHRAPAWSTHLDAALFAVGSEGTAVELVCQSGADEVPRLVVPTAGFAPAFLLSPDGRHLAYAARPAADSPLFDGLWVHQLEGGPPRRLTEEPLLAFFWCPDGERLVWATGDLGNRTIRLWLVALSAGTQTDLGWLRPTRDVWLLLSHFDQYAQSASLFSPTGEELILATSQAQERYNGSVPTVRRVLVRSLKDPSKEAVAAPGRLAFWRPQPAS